VLHLLDWGTALRLMPPAWYRIVFQPGDRGWYRAIPVHKVRLERCAQHTGDPVDGSGSSN
jgi:hypothetical protein